MPSPKRTVNLSPEADEDLIEIWGYLSREASERVADRQLHEIDKACVRLKAWPYSGRRRDELLGGMRSVLIHPYVMFYRIQDDAVELFVFSTAAGTSVQFSRTAPPPRSARIHSFGHL